MASSVLIVLANIAIVALGRENPVVNRHLTIMRYGDCDWITAMERIVIDLADSNRRLTDELIKIRQNSFVLK